MSRVSQGIITILFIIMTFGILAHTEQKTGWITVTTRFLALLLASIGFGIFLDVVHIIEARQVLVIAWCVSAALYTALIKALYRVEGFSGNLCLALCLSLTTWSLRALHLL